VFQALGCGLYADALALERNRVKGSC
jgi:hypothetical protein